MIKTVTPTASQVRAAEKRAEHLRAVWLSVTGPLHRDIRVAILTSQILSGIKCYYCGQVMKARQIRLDHKYPLARGGPHIEDNLALCDDRCNRLKGALTEFEFVRLRTFLKAQPTYLRKDIERRLLLGVARLREAK